MKKDFAHCPICAKILEQKKKPKESDMTVCDHCATMLEFNQDLQLEPLPSVKFLALDSATQHALNEIVYTIVNRHK